MSRHPSQGPALASSSGASTSRSVTPPSRSVTPPSRSETPPPELVEKQKIQKKYSDLCTELQVRFKKANTDDLHDVITALQHAIFHSNCLAMSSEQYKLRCESAYQKAEEIFSNKGLAKSSSPPIPLAAYTGSSLFPLKRKKISHSYVDPNQLPIFGD